MSKLKLDYVGSISNCTFDIYVAEGLHLLELVFAKIDEDGSG